jgi:hypothetical protein
MRPPPKNIEAVDEEMASVLRDKSPAERLRIAAGMWAFARETIISVLRQEHPDWGDSRIRREAARRLSHGAV